MKEATPLFLWKASPLRAILEGLLLSLLIFAILLPILGDAPSLVINMTALLIAGICALVSALRMLSPVEHQGKKETNRCRDRTISRPPGWFVCLPWRLCWPQPTNSISQPVRM